jgi:hypothetical protein
MRHTSTQEFLELVFTDSGGKLHLRILSRLERTGVTTQPQETVLSTRNSTPVWCNHLETKQINAEEKVLGGAQNPLTEKGLRIIVKKVPRGLRNSKPPET